MARTPTDTSNTALPNGTPAPQTSREDEILMREIDEAVRQDDTKEFFQKYGKALAGGLVVLVGGLSAYAWWDGSREAKLEAGSEAIISALDSVDAGDFAGASEKADGVIADGSDGARAVARMLQAAAALEQDDPDKAVEMYAAIVADPATPGPLRDLALVREIATSFDDRKPADIIAKLAPLTVPGNPFFGSAGELTAIAHLEAGDRDKAGALFAELAQDETVPDTLRERARQMAGLLSVDTIDDVDKLLEDVGATPPQGGAGPQR